MPNVLNIHHSPSLRSHLQSCRPVLYLTGEKEEEEEKGVEEMCR